MKEMRIFINAESGIAVAVRCARQMAQDMGFPVVSSYYIATAAAELASNLLFHGGGGIFEVRRSAQVAGIELEACDQGPGIADIARALQEGYSTGEGLGCGLPGVKRLMDVLEIQSQPGQGTRVRACKWR